MQATIMTDPGTADRTYIGPMTPELVEEIIKKVCLIPCRLWPRSTLPTLDSGRAGSVGRLRVAEHRVWDLRCCKTFHACCSNICCLAAGAP